MNILEAALLTFDGVKVEEIQNDGISKSYAITGSNLCSYLQSIKTEELR